MGLPIDLPPAEIVEALEEELNATFVHFVVSKEGVVEGIFATKSDGEQLIVSFEAKRELLNIENELEMVLSEMDDNTLEAMRTMLESMIDDVEVRLSKTVKIEPDAYTTPTFDDEWFTP